MSCKYAAITILIVALLSCAPDNSGTTQTATTIGGAVTGGIVGSQFGKGNGQLAATTLGVLLGAWAGNDIGKALSNSDRIRDRQAEQRAFNAPIGQQVTWNDPDSAASGAIIPVHDGYSPNGAYCRDFQQSITLNGQQKRSAVKACQQPDGSWIAK